MVRTLLFLSLAAAGWAQAASLTVQLDKSSAALGEAVTLTVQAQGVEIDALDFGSLDAQFERHGETLSRGADSATLVLTLYPRVPGVLKIPPLAAGGRRTPSLTLSVTDGDTRVPRVTAHWTLAPAAAQVGLPARLTLSVCDDGSLQWQRPDLPTQTGRTLRALGEDEDRGERAGEPCTLHRFHWALLPTRSGAGGVDVAMLDARRYGERLRFPGAAFAYQAAPLPAWLPAHVPAVEPTLQAEPLPARWPLDRPLAWRFDVTGGYSADGLKALLDLQLRESPALAVYPPLIEVRAPDARNSPLTRHVVTLFLQPRQSGVIELPTLRLPWYDTARGRLADVTLAGTRLTVIDPRWQRAGEAAGGLAGAVLLALLGAQARRALAWRRARRQGLNAIAAARDVDALARAVRSFSLHGAGAAVSLGDWQRRLQQETGVVATAEAVRQLEGASFGPSARPLPELRQAFLQVLADVRPRR